MDGLHALGCSNAITAANETFDSEMSRLKKSLAQATSAEEEAAIEQQMRECEARHRDLLSSLQRSLY
ncbi:hypothetical protein AB1K70_15105 [Bremerella sp. JC770]|uniref:hypothetical protein n=1 Tax=Bremerella sp. JC770 TaxID=3232137 RepID=UPI003459DF0C